MTIAIFNLTTTFTSSLVIDYSIAKLGARPKPLFTWSHYLSWRNISTTSRSLDITTVLNSTTMADEIFIVRTLLTTRCHSAKPKRLTVGSFCYPYRTIGAQQGLQAFSIATPLVRVFEMILKRSSNLVVLAKMNNICAWRTSRRCATFAKRTSTSRAIARATM